MMVLLSGRTNAQFLVCECSSCGIRMPPGANMDDTLTVFRSGMVSPVSYLIRM